MKKTLFKLFKLKKLSKLCCNKNDSILKATTHNNFKIARYSAISKIKESKKPYYLHYLQKYSTNVKQFWDGIKSIVMPNSLTLNGVTITNKKSIAETFNNFLSMLVPILHRIFLKQNTRLIDI